MIEVEGLTMRAMVPITNGKLALSTWQQVYYPEFEFSEGEEFTIKAILSEAEDL